MSDTLTAVRLPDGQRIIVRGDYTSLDKLTLCADGVWEERDYLNRVTYMTPDARANVSAFPVGTTVRRKADGLIGVVVENTDHEVVVKYQPTHRTEPTPWGPWTDSVGVTGHHFHAYASRLIESV